MREAGHGAERRPGAQGSDPQDGAAREGLLARAFVRLADTLVNDFDIVEFLHGLAADSVEILGAQAAGVMLADGRGTLRLVASSEERMRLLEIFELQGAEGPCLDAFASGQPVQAGAAESHRRWPVFGPHATEVGFRRVCAVPLRVRTDTIGALNLFRGGDEPFTEAEIELAQAMGEVAAIALIQERALREQGLLTGQLQAALNDRVTIEQAKGMLAEYLSVTFNEAFALLRKYARENNRKLSQVADDVVDRKISSDAFAGEPDPEDAGPGA